MWKHDFSLSKGLQIQVFHFPIREYAIIVPYIWVNLVIFTWECHKILILINNPDDFTTEQSFHSGCCGNEL